MNRILSKILFLIRRTLSYPMYWLSGFMPRDENLWVFGSFSGYVDNSRFLFEYINQNPQLAIRAIWISKYPSVVKDVRKAGFEAYNVYSLKGFIYPLLAKVYVHNCYISQINFATSRNAIDVNLWHGIPLKKIEADIHTPPLAQIFQNPTLKTKFIYPHSWKKPDLVLSPSTYVAEYSFKSAFRVEEKNIIYAQYPRVTFLENLTVKNHPYQNYKKVFLYTPTWRDDGSDFITESELDFAKLNQLMAAQNAIFLLKFHPATQLNVDLSGYSHIELLDNSLDPMALMKISDCLITDYSSIFFDYLILNKPIIYFCFDYENYLKNREMYLDYDETLAGEKAESFAKLYQALSDILAENDRFSERRKFIADKFLSASENKNRYIVEQIHQFRK